MIGKSLTRVFFGACFSARRIRATIDNRMRYMSLLLSVSYNEYNCIATCYKKHSRKENLNKLQSTRENIRYLMFNQDAMLAYCD